MNGFNICCIANYDSTRVELCMGNASKDYNKSIYDRLITYKAQIERDLGVLLIWNRGDDIKSCKVSCQILRSMKTTSQQIRLHKQKR